MSGSPVRERRSTFFGRLTHPVIRDERELNAYVLKTCVVCATVALGVDVVNQLIFFEGVAEALRSWGITIALASGIALPVSRAVAKANLDLYRTKMAFEQLSRVDPLTGLLNRRALFEVAADIQPSAMALVIADIDRFKRVNDTHGHLVGDRVISAISAVLKNELGDLGTVGRLGGEEFALLTKDVDANLLKLRLEQVRTRIAMTQIETREGAMVHVTVSIGAAVGGASDDIRTLYVEADKALYAAKASGRNRVVFAGSPEAVQTRDDGERAAS